MELKPLPGYALVRLKQKYESGLSTEKEKYAERSEGTLVDILFVLDTDTQFTAEDFKRTYAAARNQTVYFAPFTDGEPVKHEGEEYVFLPIKELRGVKQNA